MLLLGLPDTMPLKDEASTATFPANGWAHKVTVGAPGVGISSAAVTDTTSWPLTGRVWRT